MSEYRAALADLDGMIALAAGLAAIGIVLWAYRSKWMIRPSAGIAIFGGAVLAGLLTIGAAPLDYDESFTALITGLSPDRIVLATAGDVHPPLYYLLIALTRQVLGHSEIALRLPSLICAGLAAWMAYRVAHRYLCTSSAVLAGWIAALLPGLVRYGQDARMYSLLAALLLGAVWAATERRWLLYALCMALALYTHNYAALYLVGLLPFWSKERAGVLATAGALAAWGPWAIGGLAGQLAHVSAGFWIQPLTLPRLAEPLLMLGTGYTAPPALTVCLLALALGLTLVGAWYMAHHEFGRALLWLIFIPPAIAAVASVITRPVYLPRGFIVSMYLLPILWVDWLQWQERRGLAYAVLAVGMAFVIWPQSRSLDLRAFSQAAAWHAGDQVYHIEIGSYSLMGYYAPQAEHWLLPYASDLSQTLSQDTKRLLGFRSVTFDQVPAGRRFVVWCSTPFTTDQQRAAFDQLLAEHHLEAAASIGDSLRTFTIYEVAP